MKILDFVLPQNLKDVGEEFINIGFTFQLDVDLEEEKIGRY